VGEIAEAVLFGIYCSECGVVVDGEAVGFPRQCEECEE
jgi:hypothetical protein